ncbi:MAG TPA: hypothetical protein PK142_02675 [bacterium]|nr:hypothetical protein [bacterium]
MKIAEEEKKTENNEELGEFFEKGLELNDLVRENIKVSQEILSLTKYIKKYIIWQKIFSWIKLFLIVVPIILAFIYLPPFLKDFSASVQGMIGSVNGLVGL